MNKFFKTQLQILYEKFRTFCNILYEFTYPEQEPGLKTWAPAPQHWFNIEQKTKKKTFKKVLIFYFKPRYKKNSSNFTQQLKHEVNNFQSKEHCLHFEKDIFFCFFLSEPKTGGSKQYLVISNIFFFKLC
jgi:hypothetical protein